MVRNSAGNRKRGADALSPPPAPAPAKRLRKGYAYEPVVPVAEEPKTSPGKDRSSFGRVRNKKAPSNDYVYDTTEADPESSPLSKVSKGRKKATPAKKVEEPVEDDTEEVFPTIGPYQCEICQMITDTKADFVGHIKAKHRDVVDEEVLNSLESDIRKSNKKKQKATPAPPPPKKASPKKTPGPASKKAKPTPKAKPASKKATPKAKPASKKAAQVAEVNVVENTAAKAARDKRSESRKAKIEAEIEAENEDPLGGIDANGIGGDEPDVVMENAEEDVDQPQAQQDNELSTPPREDHEDKNEISPSGDALKKSGADLFDSLFSESQNGSAGATEVDNNVPVIVQPITEAPALGF